MKYLKLCKQLLFALSLFVGQALIACPNCAGSENSRDQYTVYILSAFIILIYIPFYILFRMANKNNPHKQQEDLNGAE